MIQMYADCSWFLLTRFVDKTEKSRKIASFHLLR